MVKEKNSVGLSREFIIHPGETIAEILEDRDMTQRELAVRTGVTEKHISTVINGQKNISAAFARKLEYALGIETSFWMNLQANYDQELIEFEDVNNISDEEIGVLKKLKEVINVWVSYGWLDAGANPAAMVLDLRGILESVICWIHLKFLMLLHSVPSIKITMWIHMCYLHGRKCARCLLKI